jgi:hypothetical protein
VEETGELIVTSVDFPYDADELPPTKEMWDATDYCHGRKIQLILQCDANTHHILWGNTSTNPRGEALMEYLVSLNLSILNQGNEATSVICRRREVIELTLRTIKISNMVNNRQVPHELSLSDH